MYRPLSFIASGLLLLISAVSVAAEPGRIAVTACPGTLYVGYAYPAFGSCPCTVDRCFLPGRYYACCGEGDPAYKKAFWKRWLRAHFCGGSMLDGLPCECICPPVGVSDLRAPALPEPPVPTAPASEPGNSGSVSPPAEDVDQFQKTP